MNLKCKLLLFMISLLLLPSFVKAEEKALAGDWTEIESGLSIVVKEEKGEFLEQLEEKIKALTLAPHEEGMVFDYSYSIESEYEQASTTYSKVNVDELFKTKIEAEEYYNNLDVEEKTNPKYKEVFSDEFEVVCDSDCENEIPSDYVCTINEIEYKTVEKTFETEAEMNAYDSKLEGYKLVSTNVTPVTTTVTHKFSGKYDTRELAEQAIADFEALYGVTSISSISYSRDTSKDVGPTAVTGTTKYYSESAALLAKAAVEGVFADKEVTATVRGPIQETEETTYKIEDIVTATFPTSAAAQAKLVELEGQGYTITSYDIKKHTIAGTGIVTTATKIDSNNESYQIDSSNNYILLKQASSVVVVWTPIQLSAAAQENFKSSYKALNEYVHYFDGSTKGDINIEFIHGYGDKDLSYLNTNPGSSWGTYTFELSTDKTKIILYNLSMSLSHIVYGVTNFDTEYYTLTGTMKKTITKDVWYVDTTTLLYGFSYYANATITLTNTKYDVAYNYERKTMSCVDPSYALSYEVKHVETTNYLLIKWFVGSKVFGVGNTTPPNTSVEFNEPNYSNIVLPSLALIVLYRKKYVYKKH